MMNLIISGVLREKAVRDALVEDLESDQLCAIYECPSVLPDHVIRCGNVILLGTRAHKLFHKFKDAMQAKN